MVRDARHWIIVIEVNDCIIWATLRLCHNSILNSAIRSASPSVWLSRRKHRHNFLRSDSLFPFQIPSFRFHPYATYRLHFVHFPFVVFFLSYLRISFPFPQKRQIFIEICVWHAYRTPGSRATNFSICFFPSNNSSFARSLVQTLNLFMGCVSCGTNENGSTNSFMLLAFPPAHTQANAFMCIENATPCTIKIWRGKTWKNWRKKGFVETVDMWVSNPWFLFTNCVQNA